MQECLFIHNLGWGNLGWDNFGINLGWGKTDTLKQYIGNSEAQKRNEAKSIKNKRSPRIYTHFEFFRSPQNHF